MKKGYDRNPEAKLGRPKNSQAPINYTVLFSINCQHIIQTTQKYTWIVNGLIGMVGIKFPYAISHEDAKANKQEMLTMGPKYQWLAKILCYLAPTSLIKQLCQICNQVANRLKQSDVAVVASLCEHYEDISLLPGLRYRNIQELEKIEVTQATVKTKEREIERQFKQYLKQLISSIIHEYKGTTGKLTDYYAQMGSNFSKEINESQNQTTRSNAKKHQQQGNTINNPRNIKKRPRSPGHDQENKPRKIRKCK